jgi:hypothetical protein
VLAIPIQRYCISSFASRRPAARAASLGSLDSGSYGAERKVCSPREAWL